MPNNYDHEYKETEQPVFNTPTDYKKELKRHQKEIANLKEENEILKKAMQAFTKNRE